MSARVIHDEVFVADHPVLQQRVAFMLPVVPDNAPYTVAEGIARRRLAATTGPVPVRCCRGLRRRPRGWRRARRGRPRGLLPGVDRPAGQGGSAVAAMSAANVALGDNGLQVAPVVRVTPTKTTRLIVVDCPLCGRRHTHGWPYGQTEIGARVAHCTGSGLVGSYRIETPT